MTDGILSEPMDLDEPRRRASSSARIANVEIGMVLTHRASGIEGSVVRYVQGQQIVLRDGTGRDHRWRPEDGAFAHRSIPVALRKLVAPADDEVNFTASGSLDVGRVPARMARASRIYVEGIHDAELIEKVWGDDLRVEGVVVEQMEGADDLAALVRAFRPAPRRRLGVLLDHLVDGSKESRLAAGVDDEHVLICGHPYVDVWEAIRPQVIGIEHWPTIAKGVPWKEGVLAALGVRDEPGLFWKRTLGKVSSYKDLETPLITAVERLIDFVAVAEN